MSASNRLILAVAPTKQQLVDYANALLAVNNYAYAITQTSLPVLSNPPDDYAQFEQEFLPAMQHCLNWTTSTLPNLLQVPSTIENADDLFTLNENNAAGYLQILVQNPSDPKAKAGLTAALTSMKRTITGQVKSITDLETELSTFTDQLTSDATSLADLAQKALATAGADQQTIDQLTTNISQLQADVASLGNWLTIAQIGSAVSIFVGLIGVVVCFIPGAQGVGAGLIIVGAGGLAASIAGWVLAQQKIDADNALIQSEKQQISQLHQDIILLQAVNAQFGGLVDSNGKAVAAMKTVKDMWTNLGGAVDAVKQELADAETAATSAQYQQALDDLTQATAAWAELVDFAKALVGIDLQWIDSSGATHSFSDPSVLVTPGGSQVATYSQAA